SAKLGFICSPGIKSSSHEKVASGFSRTETDSRSGAGIAATSNVWLRQGASLAAGKWTRSSAPLSGIAATDNGLFGILSFIDTLRSAFAAVRNASSSDSTVVGAVG